MGYKVAVVGATGNVGREMLSILEERQRYSRVADLLPEGIEPRIGEPLAFEVELEGALVEQLGLHAGRIRDISQLLGSRC